jgi:hypothetical protein
MIDERAESARPHIVAADETQPIEPLLGWLTFAKINS